MKGIVTFGDTKIVVAVIYNSSLNRRPREENNKCKETCLKVIYKAATVSREVRMLTRRDFKHREIVCISKDLHGED